MENKKEKRAATTNDCSLLRWLAVVLVIFVGGLISVSVFDAIAENNPGSFLGIGNREIFDILAFTPMFIIAVIAIRLVAKTSFKDFVLGIGGAVDKKNSLIIFGLSVLGILLPNFFTLNNVSFRGVHFGEYAFAFVFFFLTVGFQVIWEEILFRGIILRWVCKNEIRYSKKALIAAVITALAFALSHSFNSELISQSGIFFVLILFCFFISGFVYFWADIHFGSLVPGIIMHFANNFFLATVIASEGDGAAYPTLFLDSTSPDIWGIMFSDVCCSLPMIIFLVILFIKQKRSAKLEIK